MRIYLLLVTLLLKASAFNRESIEDCSRVLSENLQEIFQRVSGESQIVQYYEKLIEVEQFDPRVELKKSKKIIEEYLKRRSDFAFYAKKSLEAKKMAPLDDEEELKKLNDPKSMKFVRFMSAKQGNDGTTIYEHTHLLTKHKVNETRNFTLAPNANFYNLNTSSLASAVHVPTPLYDRNPELLAKIQWSEIDTVYRTNREEVRDLAFQLFCSESGYMRFFPATSWYWDNPTEHLDLFDCRNTQWYINAATNSKNVLIMLDMSGSMLGQRYEIAKQTTEAILETLSHNDYFNIMPFSRNGSFLDNCNGTQGLLQATMRNKKLLRSRMNNITSEGKAEYLTALPAAFSILLNLKGTWTIHTKEEFAQLLQQNATQNMRYVKLAEHYLGFDAEYAHSISHSTGRPNQGCENVIMLITDGAPSDYKELFDLYNADKKVRFFSFLIGEEAIDFAEVKRMACTNRGFMVHVQNMADVEEKIQHYIRTMSKAIGRHAGDITKNEALWSGVYRERLYLPRPETFAEPVPITNQSYAVMNKMAARRKISLQKTEARSRMFVTTVSYPVVLNGKFMGVSAVNIPLTEIVQQAHPANIGARSYYFMLDQNGFIMFHPQLRAIDPLTKTHKPNYNNMDLLELEVPQTQVIRLAQPKDSVSNFHCEKSSFAECVDELRNITRKMILDCDNSDPQELDVLYATDTIDRVYPQTNTYYSECIKGANFVLGIAVAKNDDYRAVPRRHRADNEYGSVTTDWMNDNRWRVHPYWRYCLLNDTDTNVTKEEAFTSYVKQMSESGKLPELCKARRHLVDKLLLDLEATAPLADSWDQQWQFFKENLIHLIFFTGRSGMIRFYNTTLDDYYYEDPNWNIDEHIGRKMAIEEVQESYNHFITDLNRKAADDMYYKRAVRMKGDIVFDVSNNSKIWYKSETQLTAYGLNENLTMLSQATKAVYSGNAFLGVVGFEFVYDFVVNKMEEHGCGPAGERRWCVLLDEHGYVYYSNQLGISYEDYLENPATGKHIGQWFGHINRVSQRAMGLLVEKKFYTRFTYTDHQSTCKRQQAMRKSAFFNRFQPLRSLMKFFAQLLNNLMLAWKHLSIAPLIAHLPPITEAYTASFHDLGDNQPCSKRSYFYLSNKAGRRPISTNLIDHGRYDRPCPTTKCSVRMHASFVEGTNLIMVWIHQEDKSTLCYDEAECPKLHPGEAPFEYEEIDESADGKASCAAAPHQRPPRSKAMCYKNPSEYLDPTEQPCSQSPWLSPILSLVFVGILFVIRV